MPKGPNYIAIHAVIPVPMITHNSPSVSSRFVGLEGTSAGTSGRNMFPLPYNRKDHCKGVTTNAALTSYLEDWMFLF